MSSYFQIFSRKKEVETEGGLELFFLCTTPARELNREFNFVYNKETPIDSNYVRKLAAFYQGETKVFDQAIESRKDELKPLYEALSKAETDIAYKNIKDDITAIQNEITEMGLYSDREFYQGAANDLSCIADIIDRNQEYYNFYYLYD